MASRSPPPPLPLRLVPLLLLTAAIVAATATPAPITAEALGWPLDPVAAAVAPAAASITTTTMSGSGPAPPPPVWPERFQAELFQNRSSKLAMTRLYYDWRRGVNVNVIRSQLGARGVVYDVEWNNGTSFIFSRDEPLCRTLNFSVGILRPDWLSNATFLGATSADGFVVDVFTKAAFIYFYQSRELNKPVRWTFISSGAQLDVMAFDPGAPPMAPREYAAPAHCFGAAAANASGGGGGGGWLDELGALSSGALFRELALPSSGGVGGGSEGGGGARERRRSGGGSSSMSSSSSSGSSAPSARRGEQQRVQAS